MTLLVYLWRKQDGTLKMSIFLNIAWQSHPSGFGILFNPFPHDFRTPTNVLFFFFFTTSFPDLKVIFELSLGIWWLGYCILEFWCSFCRNYHFLMASCIRLRPLKFSFVNYRIHFFLKNQQEGRSWKYCFFRMHEKIMVIVDKPVSRSRRLFWLNFTFLSSMIWRRNIIVVLQHSSLRSRSA